MAFTLKNESRHAVVVILDHPAFLNREHGWQRTTATFASQDETGAGHVAEKRRSYPGSITLQPGQEMKGLHDAIALCSQVPGLVAARVLSVKPDAKPIADPAAKSEAKPVAKPEKPVGKVEASR